MIVVQAPNNEPERWEGHLPPLKVFLAGCADSDWRKDFVKKFSGWDVLFLDPKRDDFETMTDNDMIQQINWEFKMLRDADIICYGFTSDKSPCPITLLEYGMWGLSTGRPIIVYASDDYIKRRDVIFQTFLSRPEIPVLRSMEDFIGRTQLTILNGKQGTD